MNRVVLATQLLGIGLALGGSAYVLGDGIVGAWHVHSRARIAAELRSQAGWIDEVIWDVTPSQWIPVPWAPPRSALETLATLGQAQARALTSRPLPNGDDPHLWQQVRAYHRDWATLWRFCANAELQYPGLAAEICQDYRSFPAPWRTLFADRLAGDRFLNLEHGYPLAGPRPARTVELCNLTPLAVEVAHAELIASPEVLAFYAEVLGTPAHPYRVVGWIPLAPGGCTTLEIKGIDRTPEVLVHARSQDPAFADWLADLWARHNAPELLDPAYQAAVAARLDALTGARVCTGRDDFSFQSDDLAVCPANAEPIAELEPYLAGFIAEDRLFFAMTYPGLSGYELVLSDDGSRVDPARLAAAQAEAQALGAAASRYRTRQTLWAGRLPRFDLGGVLSDGNGPLALGVEVANLPDETILHELMQVPEGGLIAAVNGEAVYSIEDIHSLLEDHGGSRSAGIMKLVTLDIFDGEDLMRYFTRFRFNPWGPQEFDTRVGIAEGFIEGLTFNSEDLACGLLGLMVALDHAECAWLDTQRNAYARQVAEDEFQLGEFASFFAPTGTGIAKGLRLGLGARRLGAVSRFALTVASEAAVLTVHDALMSPPIMPIEERIEQAKDTAVIGLVFGSMSRLLPAGKH